MFEYHHHLNFSDWSALHYMPECFTKCSPANIRCMQLVRSLAALPKEDTSYSNALSVPQGFDTMSWFDTAGFTSLAKSALKEAQRTIDKALDLEEDSENVVPATTISSPGQKG